MVERDERRLGEQDGLRLAEKRETLRGVGRAGRGVEQGVVVRAAPTGVVVAAVTAEDVEERRGIQVVTDPVGAQDLEIAGAACGENHLHFLVHQPHLHADLAPPHLLQGLGDGAVVFRGVVK